MDQNLEWPISFELIFGQLLKFTVGDHIIVAHIPVQTNLFA